MSNKGQDSPMYWRKFGWFMLIVSAVLMVLGYATQASNPASSMVVWIMTPFVAIGGALVSGRFWCEWLAGNTKWD